MLGAILRSFFHSVKNPETLSGVMDTMLVVGKALDSTQPKPKKKEFCALVTKEVHAEIKRLARSHRSLQRKVARLEKELAELKRQNRTV